MEADAQSAYTQAPLDDNDTHIWVILPRHTLPTKHQKLETQAHEGKVVYRLRLALEGHPRSGYYWEKYFHSKLRKCGFDKVPGYDCFFYTS